jgi:hypothetical protein
VSPRVRHLAVGSIAIVALYAVPPAAHASNLRRLASSITSFATDGVRYAAWQQEPGSPIVIFDANTGKREVVKLPGCVPENEEPSSEPGAPGDGRFLLSCYRELRDGCFETIGRNLVRCGIVRSHGC